MQRRALHPLAAVRIVKSLVYRRSGKSPRPVLLADGQWFAADLNSPLGLGAYRYREGFTDPDLLVMRAWLNPGDVMVDCGANVGVFSMEAGRAVGPAGRVVAFEPSPETRTLLMRNLALNDYAQAVVMPYALSNATGDVEFITMGNGGGLSSFAPADASSGVATKVTAAPLDDVLPLDLRSRVTFLKIDVEGSEHELLQGAAQTIAASRPAILIELEDEHLKRQGSSAREVEGLLVDWGYRVERRMTASPNVLFVAT